MTSQVIHLITTPNATMASPQHDSSSMSDQEFKQPKRPSVFSKGIKKLSRSASMLNFNAITDNRDNSPQKQMESNTTPSGDNDLEPLQSPTPWSNNNGNFQAIGYNSLPAENKEPIHVIHLPEKSRNPSEGSQRKVSNSSQNSFNDHHRPSYGDYRANSVTSSSAASVTSSLDPKAKPMENQSQSGLAAIGLNLAGYGLSNDDLLPPKPVKRSTKQSQLNTIYQHPGPSFSASGLSEEPFSPPPPPPPQYNGLPQINTRTSSLPGKSSPSPMFTSSTTSSPMQTKTSDNSHLLLSFSTVVSNINQMPDPDVVDNMFEKLLSIRAFNEKAVQKLRELPTKRKWELLLRESESNTNFDLKLLMKRTVNRFDNQGQSNTRRADDGFGASVKRIMTNSTGNNDDMSSFMSSSNIPSTPTNKKSRTKDGTPEWYVFKIFGDKLNTKDYKRLEKRLTYSEKHPEGIIWISDFINSQGEAALSVILSRINKKSIKSNEEFDREFYIIKCLRNILNLLNVETISEVGITPFAYTGYSNKLHIVKSITFSIISPRLATKILVTELLIFISYNNDTESFSLIQESMAGLQDMLGDLTKYQPWLNSFESFLDKYFVGERSSSKDNYALSMRTYSLNTLFLVNAILEQSDQIKSRITIRRDFSESRLLKIFDKLRVINDSRINEEIERYEAYAEEDYNVYFGLVDSSQSVVSADNDDHHDLDSQYQLIKQEYSVNDPTIKSIFTKIVALKLSGRSGEEIHQILKLLDNTIHNLVMKSNVSEIDSNSILKDSIEKYLQNLLGNNSNRTDNYEKEELITRIKTLEETNKKLEVEASFGLYDTLEALKNENSLSADKIVEQERKIILLKKQLQSAESVQVTKPSLKSKPDDNQALIQSVLPGRSRNNKGNKIVIDELEGKLAVKPNGRDTSSMSTQAHTSSSSDTYSPTTQQDSRFKGIIGDLKDNLEGKFTTPRPPTPPSFFTKQKASFDTDYFQEGESLSGDFHFHDEPYLGSTINRPNKVVDNSLTNVTKPISLVLTPAGNLPPPPPPPPIPKFLDDLSNINDKQSTKAESLPPPPPPPPPPAIPQFLDQIVKDKAQESPKPQSAPPVPQFLSDISKKELSPSSGSPPPPPPVPQFLNDIANKGPSSQGPTPPPPPPPLPPPLLVPPGNKTPPKSEDVTATANTTTETPEPENVPKQQSETPPDPKTTIPELKPKSKLKQMHWDKIDNINQTFWHDIEHGKVSDQLQERGILDDVEKHFVAKLSAMKLRKDVLNNTTQEGNKNKKVSLLTRDIAQQFGINLHMFANLEVEQLVLKVLHCDKDILDNVAVLEFFNSDGLAEINENTIRNFKPFSRAVNDPNSKPRRDPNELERPDRIYLELMFNLRHYWRSRTRALLLIQSYQKDYLDLLRKLRVMDDANRALRNSESLRQVLGIIRSVGNFMNDHSKRALGFRLDTLQRLKFMKDETNSMHFLHYVEKIIRNTFPEFGSFVDELNILIHVQNVSIEQLETECQEFDRHLNGVNSSITRGNLSDPTVLDPEDYILQTVASPLENAKIKNSLLQAHVKKTVEEHNSLMTYFGENHKETHSRNTFYDKFLTFVSEFKRAHIENVQKEEEVNAIESRKRIIEENKVKRDNNNKAGDNSNKENTEESKSNHNKVGKNGTSSGTSTENDTEYDATEYRTDEPQDDDNGNNDESGSNVIDDLLEKLRTSKSTHSSSTKAKSMTKKRSQALSFYSSSSLDKLLDPPYEMTSTESNKENHQVNTKSTSQIELSSPSPNEYESVNHLKRRLTSRKREANMTKQVESNSPIRNDKTMLRTQTMLNQLRSEENLANPNASGEVETKKISTTETISPSEISPSEISPSETIPKQSPPTSGQ